MEIALDKSELSERTCSQFESKESTTVKVYKSMD